MFKGKKWIQISLLSHQSISVFKIVLVSFNVVLDTVFPCLYPIVDYWLNTVIMTHCIFFPVLDLETVWSCEVYIGLHHSSLHHFTCGVNTVYCTLAHFIFAGLVINNTSAK